MRATSRKKFVSFSSSLSSSLELLTLKKKEWDDGRRFAHPEPSFMAFPSIRIRSVRRKCHTHRLFSCTYVESDKSSCTKVLWRRMILRNAAVHQNRPCLFCPKFSGRLKHAKVTTGHCNGHSDSSHSLFLFHRRGMSQRRSRSEKDRKERTRTSACFRVRPTSELTLLADLYYSRDRAQKSDSDPSDGRWTY